MIAIEVFRTADQVSHVPKGTTIFRAGDEGDTMFAVIAGSVDIYVDDVAVERIELGGFFGEMALIDEAPRSATAIASADSTLAVINRDQFERLVSTTPLFAITVMEQMATRLRRANHSASRM